MKIHFNPTKCVSNIPLLSGATGTKGVSTQSTLVSGSNSPGMKTIREIGQILYRMLTFFLNLRAPSISDFVVPEMTTEGFEECRRLIYQAEGMQWSTGNPFWTAGPSQRQKAILVHQLVGFYDHMKELAHLDNGKANGIVTIQVAGQNKSIQLKVDMTKNKQFYIKEMLAYISNPSFYKHWEDATIRLSFDCRCSVDSGKGPIYFYRSFLSLKNTCHTDKHYAQVTTEPIAKWGGTSRYFSPASIDRAHQAHVAS